jgi:hypothetical protein
LIVLNGGVSIQARERSRQEMMSQFYKATTVFLHVFSLSSTLSVARAFYMAGNGVMPISAAARRSKPEMTFPLDSLTLILLNSVVENIHLSLTV